MVGHGAAGAGSMVKKGRGREYYEEEYEDDDDIVGGGGGSSSGKKMSRESYEGYAYGGSAGSGGKAGASEKKGSRIDRDLEEKDVVSSVATVLSDLCGPGEWMPMEKLHSELVEQFGSIWHHSRVRRYLTSDDWPGPESMGKPWYGLLMLLRKYPEHFVINMRSKGRITLNLSLSSPSFLKIRRQHRFYP